ncbi:MAG: hypothetical protein K6C10_02200 [Prevotella sp.]|nr:hypothetical protein [Prevotella sp.]
MQRLLTILGFFLLLGTPHLFADGFDDLQQALLDNSQVQEKVYVHTDNTCYFVGDTLWYKAYVLRADDLSPTDMSKLLYVELLSPDGLVVERQRIVVSDEGYTCGQFVLQDSLYSGYYELRAYTRWMLNFNVSHRHYNRDDRHLFYSNQMAADFFREWDGLYSRVLPVYSKPAVKGDYDAKYMYERPKQDIRRQPKEQLICRFYPEGGQIVEGLPSRVAFELVDQLGKCVDLSGKLSDGTVIKTDYMGRGMFELSGETTKDNRQKASFNWRGKDYSFNLPKVQKEGMTLRLSAIDAQLSASIHASSTYVGKTVAVAVLCRGRLVQFQKQLINGSQISFEAPLTSIPTGVNELLVFDEERNILASRLFFVNHHDLAVPVEVSTGGKIDFKPYEAIPLSVSCQAENDSQNGDNLLPSCFSVSVRDAHTDDVSYSDGNMLSELLLSSDLKGFVAHPAYYFESDDAEHRSRLDMLMMVQGWRRYRPVSTLRYEPERNFTVEGSVYKMLGLEPLRRDQIAGLNSIESVFMEQQDLIDRTSGMETGGTFTETEASAEQGDAAAKETSVVEEPDFAAVDNSVLGVNHGGLRHEVLVEAEIVANGETAGAIQLTRNGGHFIFELPPYYGSAILFMKAYERKDSVEKCFQSRIDKGRLDEDAYADFYVKRDLFYPVFAREYSWYEKHQPDYVPTAGVEEDVDLTDSRLDGDHTLSQVNVSARRRGRRAVDYTKPAFVIDAYDLYNLATDRGLSWGLVNMGTFPYTACYTLYGNMGYYRDLNVQAKLADGHNLDRKYTFYRNYQSTELKIDNRAEGAIFNDLHLNRLCNFRFYTDYEPRNPDSLYTVSVNREDITLVYETLPNNAKQPTYRDRRFILPGFAEPADCYQPDYSQAIPTEPTDYRRTLYWNPNARFDESGQFSTTLYNNSKETRLRVSVAAITPDGHIVTN